MPVEMLAIRPKTPLKSRTLSPSQYILSPNNDDYERAQVRAARVAAQRRKSFVGIEAEKSQQKVSDEIDLLGKEQILDLFQNCIKLAAENKINQRNTWELRLIDHISEIVNTDDGEDVETNFQKASCTLEAGVKIYAYRVDSVHSETFKVLGGLNRTAACEGDMMDGDPPQDVEGVDEENGNKKRESQKKVTTSAATLESYDALNVKKFDVAFTVDPLFHQMSAQFDEGGAKGLLLNTLGVYNGCKLVFDSMEVPSKHTKINTSSNGSMTIDLSCMKDCIERLNMDMKVEAEISPTLQELLAMLEDPRRQAAEVERAKGSDKDAENHADSSSDCSDVDGVGEVLDGNMDDYKPDKIETTQQSFDGEGPESATWDYDLDGQEDGEVDNQDSFGVTHQAYNNENETMLLVDWLSAGLDLKSNAWAGPDHWKFKKAQAIPKGPEPVREKRKTKGEKFAFDFSCLPQVDMSIFAPPTDIKSLLMPQSNASVSTLLPDDCHYQPEDLVRLFLQPSIMCINHKGKMEAERRNDAFEMGGMGWGDCGESGFADGDDWDEENVRTDLSHSEDYGEMIPQPRKVQKIEVDYDKTSKQIDVRALKETLWQNLQDVSYACKDSEEAGIPFKNVLCRLPTACGGVAALGDISVHLCFICLLHLANEHSLRILDCSGLDELYIQNVIADTCESEVISG